MLHKLIKYGRYRLINNERGRNQEQHYINDWQYLKVFLVQLGQINIFK